MTHVIAVANEKGGVAKTTTVISLGGALVEMDYEVLLVDLDAQANLSLGLGFNPASVRHSVADMLINSVSLISISRETNVPGMDIVPSNADMGMAERFLPVRQNYEYLLKNIFLSLLLVTTVKAMLPLEYTDLNMLVFLLRGNYSMVSPMLH